MKTLILTVINKFKKINTMKIDFFSIFLNVFCLVALIFFVGHTYTPLIDIGREFYYPQRMLSGSVFIKDLSSLFFPMSYFINTILFLIFNKTIYGFYFAGIVSSLLFINILYKISNKFCTKLLSFAVSFSALVISITTYKIMNMHLPYSWAFVYGIIAFLYSVYYLISYLETDKSKYFYICAFFAGLACAFKYELILPGLFLLFFAIKRKKYNSVFLIVSPLFLSYLILLIQGVRLDDFIHQIEFVKSMFASTHANIFYKFCGIKFSFRSLYFSISSFIKVLFLGFLYFKAFKIKNSFLKYFSFLFLICLFCFVYLNKGYTILIFSFCSLFLIFMYVLKFKLLSNSLKIVLFLFITFLLKNIWCVFLGGYGNYFAPFAILSIAILFSEIYDKNFQNKLAILIIFLSLFVAQYNLKDFSNIKYPIFSSKGKIYTDKITADNTNILNDFILKNTGQSDTIVILPIGHTINFLTGRNTLDYFNYFSPEYLDCFSEDAVIEQFKKINPPYIVITNQDSSSHGAGYICKDYGIRLCDFIFKNYYQIPLEQTINDSDEGLYYKIYKINDN